jgi:plastocyanin
VHKTLWLLSLLQFFAIGSAAAANYQVGIGVDCPFAGVCFWPTPLIINAGDTVTFFIYGDAGDNGAARNVVADDGSFRCARGCDGEGGDGTPAGYSVQWRFTHTFTTPGTVSYHDEVSGTRGAIIVQSAPGFAIDPGITGAWYDPNQSGHGLFVEILPDNRFYASWFAFNPAGTEQSWFTGVGTYTANTAIITEMQMPTGGRWIPNFNPDQIVRNAWGTLSFVFTDCNHGTLTFNSVAGYGTGSMNLTRLTQPAGLTCPL